MFAEPPPPKRQKTAPSGEAAMPGSRMLRQTLFVVMFLVRMSVRIASFTKIRRMIQRYVGHAFRMVSGQIEGLRHEVVRGHREIESLRHEVERLSRPCSSCHANQHTRLELNQGHATADGSNSNTRLCFQNGLKPHIYTDENVTSENNAAIKLAMYQGDKIVTSGALSKMKVEIMVLRGDFTNKCRDNWTEDDFDKHIVQGRDGQDLVLGTAWLTNGEVEFSQIRFKEGSCRKKVIMAARVCKGENTSGRVLEAIMNPVIVLDRRNKPNEKRHPPRLGDELYRLEEISRDGVYHKRLLEAKIYKVEGFLKAFHEDSNKLRRILKMEKQQNSWSKLTEHARECVLEDRQELKRYQSKEGNVVLFFNCVHDLIGAAFPHEYVDIQRFDTVQKASANKWKRHAYDKLEGISPDYVMKGNIPQPISPSADVAGTASVLASAASQPFGSANQLAPSQGTRATKTSPRDELIREPIYPIANCGPTIPDDLNSRYSQGTGTAETLHQEEHVTGPVYPTANCCPIVTNPDDLDTRYCQDQRILHGQQQIMPPWRQNSHSRVDSLYNELASMIGMYDSTGASCSAQPNIEPQRLPQPHQVAHATAPAWTMVATMQPSFPEQDQGFSGVPGSGHPNDFH